jgi:hypothetical protein
MFGTDSAQPSIAGPFEWRRVGFPANDSILQLGDHLRDRLAAGVEDVQPESVRRRANAAWRRMQKRSAQRGGESFQTADDSVRTRLAAA